MWPFGKQPLWQPVHKKAMRAFAAAAAKEHAQAQMEHREYDISNACRDLGLMMCGEDRAANVHAMISQLKEEGGLYLAGLIQEHGKDVLPGAGQDLIDRYTDHLKNSGMAPQLVICNVIENTYGREEATRYAMAVVLGDAT